MIERTKLSLFVTFERFLLSFSNFWIIYFWDCSLLQPAFSVLPALSIANNGTRSKRNAAAMLILCKWCHSSRRSRACPELPSRDTSFNAALQRLEHHWHQLFPHGYAPRHRQLPRLYRGRRRAALFHLWLRTGRCDAIHGLFEPGRDGGFSTSCVWYVFLSFPKQSYPFLNVYVSCSLALISN